ncbi:MAG: type II toxin-antitoxin system VapC family toxin [Chloroflexi bacterium]|nr:type II toxin-antitoxin system VapC family toxin [Chloroflexota bacterium]
MILLLDAHALLWWLADDPTLDAAASRSIADPANAVLVSAATVWEIEVKRVAGRLHAPAGLLDAIGESGIDTLPVTAADAVNAAGLPMHHADPFDRMLVAQAQRLDAIIVSRDRALAAYQVEFLLA